MRTTKFLVVLAIFLLLAGGGAFSFWNHQRNLQEVTLRNQENLASGFMNTVWKAHRYKIMPVVQAAPKDMEDNVDVAVFASDLMRYFEGMKVESVAIYSPAQQMLMSFAVTPGVQVLKPSKDLLVAAVSTDKPQARTLSAIDGSMQVQGVVPVMAGKDNDLLMVMTSDVTAQNKAFLSMLALLLGGVALATIGIMMLSYYNLRRAENVIAKQFEENADLVAQAALAKEENQQKSQFLANITHELRTPLNAIIGFSDILKNEFVPAPGQASHVNYISDIHSAGTHLLSLINDILDFSKAEAGKLELEVMEVNAVKVIQNCMRMMQPRAEMAQVRLVESLPKDAVIVQTDNKKFKQILLNLLSNAVKFTPPNGVVKISAWLNMQDDSWVFEVRDSGIGIAPKDISRAMSPFGQVDNALSRKYEGTGLGLPLTKRFVELMGGNFSIESELNKGTAVIFSLPREFRATEGIIVKEIA